MRNIDQNTPRGIDLTGSPRATVTVDSLDIDSSSNANAIYVDDSSTDLTVTGSSINDTSVGIQVDNANNDVIVTGSTSIDNVSSQAIYANGDADYVVNDSVTIDQPGTGIQLTTADSAVISGASITGASSQAIQINNPGSDVTINESTTIDQASTGIDVNVGGDNVDIDNVEINGSSNAGIDLSSNLADDTVLNVTDSTFTQNAGGLNVTGVAGTATDGQFNVHFNTFENNADAGIYVDDGSFDGTLNTTFNDFEGNANNALEVNNIAGNGVVNANYSWWDNPNHSRIVGPYTPKHGVLAYHSVRSVYSYTQIHMEGQP